MSAVPPDIAAIDAAIARMEARLCVLDKVDEIGLEIIDALRDQVVANPSLALAAATAYARVSRAIRLSIMLATRTEEALHALRAGQFGQGVEARAPAAREAAAVVRDQPGRETAKESDRESADREARDVLEDARALDALEERLDSYIADEARADPNSPPRSSAVARLCADLKLVPVRLSRPRASLYGASSRAPLLVPANADPPPRPLRRALE